MKGEGNYTSRKEARSKWSKETYKVINIEKDTLNYRAVTVTGKLYDEFDLVKQTGKANLLINKYPSYLPERNFESTDDD